MPVLTIPNGNMTCAVDVPNATGSVAAVGGFDGVAQCALRCTGIAACVGINLRNDTTLCDMYFYFPRRLAIVPGCTYGQVKKLYFLYNTMNCNNAYE